MRACRRARHGGRQPFDQHLLHQCVFEGPALGDIGVGDDQSERHRFVDVLRHGFERCSGDDGEEREVQVGPDERRDAHELVRLGCESGEATLDRSLDRRRDDQRVRSARACRAPGLDGGADELTHEERVAARRGMDALGEGVRRMTPLRRDQRRDQLAGRPGIETTELDASDGHRALDICEQRRDRSTGGHLVGPDGADQQERLVREPGQDPGEQGQRGRIDPVQVVDHEHGGSRRRGERDRPLGREQDPEAPELGIVGRRWCRGQAADAGEQRREVDQVGLQGLRPERAHEGFERVRGSLERDPVVHLAGRTQHRPRLRELADEAAQQRGLPDAGRTGDDRDPKLAFTTHRVPRLAQRAQLVRATEHGAGCRERPGSGGRPARRGRRLRRGFEGVGLVEHREAQRLDPAVRRDPELLAQGHLERLVRRECVALMTAPVLGEHELLGEHLPPRVLRHEQLQLRDRRERGPNVEPAMQVFGRRDQPLLVEPGRVERTERSIREVAERSVAPEPQCVLIAPDALLRIIVGDGSGNGQRFLEAHGIRRRLGRVEEVAAAVVPDDRSAERAPEPADRRLQRVGGGGVVPDVLRDRAARNRFARADDEPGQHRALTRASDGDHRAVVLDDEWTQDPDRDAHRALCPGTPYPWPERKPPGAPARAVRSPAAIFPALRGSGLPARRSEPVGDVVLVDVDDGVATITLNRPEARNALNREVRRRLPQVITELEQDVAVDVMILTGADPAFSAGIDLKELGTGQATGTRDDLGTTRGALPPCTKLLIGAINGVAVTGGFEIALACDFLVASERARFADTHARVGIMPGWGLTVLLPQRVGVARAREMSVTGNFVGARARVRLGSRQPRRAPRRAAPVLPAACRRLPHDRPGRGATDVAHLRRGQPREPRRGLGDRGSGFARVAGRGLRPGRSRAQAGRDHPAGT